MDTTKVGEKRPLDPPTDLSDNHEPAGKRAKLDDNTNGENTVGNNVDSAVANGDKNTLNEANVDSSKNTNQPSSNQNTNSDHSNVTNNNNQENNVSTNNQEETNTTETQQVSDLSGENIFSENGNMPKPDGNDLNFANIDGIEFDIPIDGNEDIGNMDISPATIAQAQAELLKSEQNAISQGIPYAPGYSPLTPFTQQQGQDDTNNSSSTPQRQTRRRGRNGINNEHISEFYRSAYLAAQSGLQEDFTDPESKWNGEATERLIQLFAQFGRRKILDEKLHNAIVVCLESGGNPSVPLASDDGFTFTNFLTIAAESGDMKLVEIFLTKFREEFTTYDIKTSLNGALRNREQEIADYILKETDVVPDYETLMEMLDVQMNDEAERKTLPLKTFIEKFIDTNKFPQEEFFKPEVLNRAICAHNVAACKVLFEQKKDEFLPLLEVATPDTKVIRAGRGKAQDIGEGVPPLVYAAVMESAGCLDVFLQAGANPNFVWNEMGGTLLHIVGQKGNTEMIDILISNNADPRIPNDRGVVPLTRTKGRKARKSIMDAVEQFNQLDGLHTGSIPLPDTAGMDSHLRQNMGIGPHSNLHHFVGMQDPIVLPGDNAPFNSIMAHDPESQTTPLPHEFSNYRAGVVDMRRNTNYDQYHSSNPHPSMVVNNASVSSILSNNDDVSIPHSSVSGPHDDHHHSDNSVSNNTSNSAHLDDTNSLHEAQPPPPPSVENEDDAQPPPPPQDESSQPPPPEENPHPEQENN